ncbi:MAG TPA: putative nucleotidyltransferase substrate binding domain-containing protein [Marinobacterium sp.]|nr:putative nucleotidyltransferase substrate binding domain-containing protein [Marinobacterium sp.]
MEAEHFEIAEFLGRYPPFDQLPPQELNRVATHLEISYYRAGSDIFRFGEEIRDLGVIRSGSVEIYRRNGDLYNRLSTGDLFGQLGLLMSNRVRLPSRAIEDSLIYFIPEVIFTDLCERFETFALFVEVDNRDLLNRAVTEQKQSHALSGSKLSDILTRQPVLASQEESIRKAAIKMAEENVSSLLIVEEIIPLEDDGVVQSRLVGIVTDRDLRRRVVAKGYDIDRPIAEVMTASPVTATDDTYVFEAMLTMLRLNLHHLPVLSNQRPVGVVAISDLVRYESKNSLYIVSQIHRAQSLEELVQLSNEVEPCFVRMVQDDANSEMIASAMSTIGLSFKQRLLELSEMRLGNPPVPYCFLALGSMARDEQLLVTDQDNALILADEYRPELHARYFEQLAQEVCDGLAACGYKLCSGEIMATNPEWRKTESQWRECFANWIDNPDPEALLNCSIFFDLEGVFGETRWAVELNQFIVDRARQSAKFLSSMARNALLRTPPLGFFKDFVMEQDGEHRRTINLKRRGTAPLVDLIRVHALACGSTSRNSFSRIASVTAAGLLPDGRASELRYAMEYLMMVRIRHQVEDIEAGEEPANTIEPDKLSSFERRNLKEAFNVISNAQRFLKFRYPSGRN